MPTAIGLIFFALGALCFLFREEGLLPLLLVAAVFQASSAINIGDRGIQPYYVVVSFMVLRAGVNLSLLGRWPRALPEHRWLLLFALIAVSSAFVLPMLFAGLPVYDPKVGLDDGFLIHTPLNLNLNNVAQAGFLVFHVAALYASSTLRFSAKGCQRALLLAFYMTLCLVVLQSAAQLTGFHLPDSVLRNNPGYAIADVSAEDSGARNPGAFSEASFAGAFFVMCTAAFISQLLSGRKMMIHLLASLVATGLVASSGSLLSLAITIVVMFGGQVFFGRSLQQGKPQLKKVAIIGLLLVLPVVAVLTYPSSYRDTLLTLTVSKGDTGSFIHRTTADLFALTLLPATHWLGVGLGSNRASSLLTSLLSNVGVVGFCGFLLFYIRVFLRLPQNAAWLRPAALALLLNMAIDIPDVTFPLLWIPALLAVAVRSSSFSRELRDRSWFDLLTRPSSSGIWRLESAREKLEPLSDR